MNDLYHRWAGGILAFIVFLFFLVDIAEFVAWKYHHVIASLFAHK
jgi:hypothetical protein